MKLTNRGFTLVELMIVIAIIGILAAALFPSLTSYLANSRDSGRVANLRSIKVAAAAFFTNNGTFTTTTTPAVNGVMDATYCVDSGSLNQYMSNKVPGDKGRTHAGCVDRYAAGTGTINGAESLVLYAGLESKGKWNTGSYSAAGIAADFNGDDITTSLSGLKTGGTFTGYLDVQ